MIMEAPRETYLAWHRQHKAEEKNRKLGQKYEQVSADAPISSPNGSVCLGEILTSGELVEDIVSDELVLMELREKLAAWKPWAPELLDMYFDEKKKSCTGFLAEKYGVSEQVVRKYKRQFEEFIKKFFEGVSF